MRLGGAPALLCTRGGVDGRLGSQVGPAVPVLQAAAASLLPHALFNAPPLSPFHAHRKNATRPSKAKKAKQ